MARGVVVIYFCELGGRLHTHQEVMLAADAKAIAALKRYDFGGLHLQGQRYSGHVFFVPDDTLLRDEARSLGIRGPNDLYGGVVPHPFVKTKAITHALVDSAAERPEGWSDAFAERVRDVVLPGYTVFNVRDARRAAQSMLRRGAIRVKRPLAAEGKGQTLITSAEALEPLLADLPGDEMATYGLVIEENLREVTTLSVGHITLDELTVSYYGTQRRTTDNKGGSVYGGSDLVCVRGGWEALERLPAPRRIRTGIAQAKLYDETMREYAGFLASRRNYDVGQGVDGAGETRSGVLESSWRVGGATGAEAVALAAFMRDPELHVVEASHVAEFGLNRQAPADAIIHFQGEDPHAGPMIRYTLVTRTQRAA